MQCFIAERDIRAQREWEAWIKDRIQNSQLFLLLFSAASRDSGEVRKEVELAIRHKRETWVFELEPTKINDFFRDENFMQRNFYRGPRAFEEILDNINLRWPVRDKLFCGQVLPNNCPYPGPAPFSDKFADLFFGRLEATQALVAAVNGDKRMLLVWGPSGAGKTSLLTVGLGKALAPQYFYSRPIDGASAGTLLVRLKNRLSPNPVGSSEDSDEDMANRIVAGIRERPETDLLFCFDQMENFFTWPPPTDQEINRFLDSMRTVLRKSPKRVTVMISFRKESLADVQPHIKRYFENDWGEFIVRKLTSADALICITEPARRRGVEFDEKLAKSLIAPIEQDQGGGDPIVDPMNVQKICQALWRDVAAKRDRETAWRIDGNILPEILGKDEGLEKNAGEYIKTVLQEYLHVRIAEIAMSLPPDTAGPKPEDYVLLSLLEFVGPNNVRQRVRETATKFVTKNGTREERLVGRLTLDVVNQLVSSGLVQRCGDKEYELAHDALADEIGKHGEASDSVSAMKNLDSVLSRENLASQADSGFNRDSELLARLEPVRENKWPFQEKEAELIFRRALGDHRRSVRGAKISVEAWANVLAEKAPGRLIQALEDGLADPQESVQVDVLDLLLKPAVRDLVRVVEAEPLGPRLSSIALDSSKSHEVREKASKALDLLGYEKTIASLFDLYKKPETRYQARTALALIRHAEDTSDNVTAAFKTMWNGVGRLGRLNILTELWHWRWQQSYTWMLYMIAVAAPVTAVGAALPFIPLGRYGASLTMDTDYGIAAGIFHGITGGLIWGLGVTAGLLIYCVILRGGRIRNKAAEAFGMATAASIGGAIGGLGNTAVIALVFVRLGLYRAGWFGTPDPNVAKWHQVMAETLCGWIMPIFGAALGIGIGLSLKKILSNRRELWISGSASPLAKGEMKKSLGRICLEVFKQSWVNIFWIGLGALAAALIIHPGLGTCDPSIHALPDDCIGQPILPPTWVRSAGLGIVILGGSLGQEIGFLFGLLSVQFGVNLKQNREFLRSAQLEAAH